MKKLVTVIAGRPVLSAAIYSVLFGFLTISMVIFSAMTKSAQSDAAEVIATGFFFGGFVLLALLPATIIRFLFYKKLLESVPAKNYAVLGVAVLEALMFFSTLTIAHNSMITPDGVLTIVVLGLLYVLQIVGASIMLGVVSTIFSKTIKRTMEGFKRA